MAENGSKRLTVTVSIIGLLITALVIVVTSSIYHGKESATVLTNSKEISINTKHIEYNTAGLREVEKHVTMDEIDTPYIKQDVADIKKKINAIEIVQQQILIEVKKP